MTQSFNFEKTDINGLIQIKPFFADDNRGYFMKDYSLDIFNASGIDHEIKEAYYSYSHAGVIRGIHFQREKQQTKLIRVISGLVFDVIVDLRKDSDTFSQWRCFYLSDKERNGLYIPGGCGHGFLAIEPTIMSYKCSEKFFGEYDDGIKWDDQELEITWPLQSIEKIIISDKDQNLQSFSSFIKKHGGLR